MMKEEPRGRLYQERIFELHELNGLRLEQLIVCEEPYTKEPMVIYLKPENKSWHQYFLDAGMGFWENWNEVGSEDDFGILIDYTDKLSLKNQIINRIYCEIDFNNSKIVIEFTDDSKLILQCITPEIFDSTCEIIMEKQN